MAYESTTVPVDRSQAEIRRLLTGFGAREFAFGESRDDAGGRWAAVSFAHDGHRVRLRVPLRLVDESIVSSRARRARTRSVAQIRDELYEQEERRIWRVMAWNLKARMVAVQEGVETFEEAFLAHLLDSRSGRTVYELLAEDGRVELAAPLAAARALAAAHDKETR